MSRSCSASDSNRNPNVFRSPISFSVVSDNKAHTRDGSVRCLLGACLSRFFERAENVKAF